jgi:hypothetical protein
MYIPYSDVNVYDWNRINGKLAKFIPCIRVAKVMIRTPIWEKHV